VSSSGSFGFEFDVYSPTSQGACMIVNDDAHVVPSQVRAHFFTTFTNRLTATVNPHTERGGMFVWEPRRNWTNLARKQSMSGGTRAMEPSIWDSGMRRVLRPGRTPL